MCKTPASECKGVNEDVEVPEEEEDAVTGHSVIAESAVSSGHSYMSDSSAEDGTESDGESASGNRVTPFMLLFHIMKEKGIISEEQYKILQESPAEADLKRIAPRIVRGFDPDSDDESYSFDTGNFDDDDDDVSDYDENPDDEDTNEGNQTESVVGTSNTSPEKVIEKSNEQNHEIIGDGVSASQKSTSPKIMDTIQGTEIKVLEGETFDKGAQGDIKTNDTEISQKVEYLEVNRNDNKDENKPEIIIATPVTEDLDSEEEEETSSTDDETTVSPNEIVSEELESEFINGFEGKRTESIDNILKEMLSEKRMEEDQLMVLETYASDLDEFYDFNRNTKKFREPNKTLREFAIFLHYYSPTAYNYIRETFVTPLPSYKVLYSWYMKNDLRPGLTKKAFEILKSKSSGKKLYCTLMSDAVCLTNIGLNYDQVDFGGGCNYEYTDKAVMVFVLLLVGLEGDWKMPIGYFLARYMPAETHAAFIKMCLTQCHSFGVDVVAVTLETPAPAEHLGCSFNDVRNLKTTFKHPECDREVAVWIDPCLAIRSIYHTLKTKNLIYFHDSKIKFNMIRRLKKVCFCYRLKFEEGSCEVELRHHLAKVGLTAPTLSDGLRPAISLCEEIFPRNFKNSSGTTDFIGAINNLYEILNSKLPLDSGYQRAMDANSNDVLDILDAAKGYFVDIFTDPKNSLSMFDKDNYKRDHVYRTFIDGKPICGFVVYLICIESLKHLFNTLVKTGDVPRLATHRLCKDHIEDFIRHMRRNEDVEVEDFTAWNYQSYLTALLEELEKKPRLSDRSLLLEYYPVENKCSPVAEIKVTSGKRAFDDNYSYGPRKLPRTDHEERATKIVRGISVALDTEGDVTTRKHMVAYLAGWIAAKFAKCLKCEECIDCLLTDKKLWFHKFITLKDLSGICLPSEELFRVCWESERVLRSGVRHPQGKVLRGLLPRFPWASRRGVHHPLHHVHLVRAIVSKYIPLRVPWPLSKKVTMQMMEMFLLIKFMNLVEPIQDNGMEDL